MYECTYACAIELQLIIIIIEFALIFLLYNYIEHAKTEKLAIYGYLALNIQKKHCRAKRYMPTYIS